jgi:Protein of unknown function (DUF4229)
VSFKPSPMFRYTLLRLGMFAATFLVIWGLVYVRVLPAGLGNANFLWVILLAMAVSAGLSFVLLRGAREKAAVQFTARVDRMRENMAATAAHEDSEDVEAATAAKAAKATEVTEDKDNGTASDDAARSEDDSRSAATRS